MLREGFFVGFFFLTGSSNDANVLRAKHLLIAHTLFIISADTTLEVLKRKKHTEKL